MLTIKNASRDKCKTHWLSVSVALVNIFLVLFGKNLSTVLSGNSVDCFLLTTKAARVEQLMIDLFFHGMMTLSNSYQLISEVICCGRKVYMHI